MPCFEEDRALAPSASSCRAAKSVYGRPDAPKSDPALFGLGRPAARTFWYEPEQNCMAHHSAGRSSTSDERGRRPRGGRSRRKNRHLWAVKAAKKPPVWRSQANGHLAARRALGHRQVGNAPLADHRRSGRRLVRIQFHPEVAHTHALPRDPQIVLLDVAGLSPRLEGGASSATRRCENKGEAVPKMRADLRPSGGVDCRAAVICHRALGDRWCASSSTTACWREGESRA